MQPDADPETELGPAMRALPGKHQAFVLALLAAPPGRRAQTQAARVAGLGTPQSNARTMTSIASRLAADPKIQDALHEEGLRHLRSAAPRAVSALVSAIERPGHKHHIRAAIAVLQHVYPTELNVSHTIEDRRPPMPITPELIARIVQIAQAVGVDPGKMPGIAQPAMIDVTPNSAAAA